MNKVSGKAGTGAGPCEHHDGHFQQGGEAYALNRPSYPGELARHLADCCTAQRLAIDVGCGSGQLSVLLADRFDEVVATDLSADQLAHARQRPNIHYRCEPAESMSTADGSADLIVAAQAAHWFDLERFYRECRRVGRGGALLALVSYGVPYLEGPLNARFQRFYWQQTTPFWPAGREHVETGYSELAFPFETLATPRLFIRREWALGQFLDYTKTWSAYRRALEQGESDVFRRFERELSDFWGSPDSRQSIVWPVSLRLGRL